MTRRFEQRPGSDETLLALHEAVAAAEEFDLAEEAHAEAFWADVRVLYDWSTSESDNVVVAVDDVEEAEEADWPDRLTMSHAVGIVEHLLGGSPMRSGEHPAR